MNVMKNVYQYLKYKGNKMKYNVMIEPFDEGLEYVCETENKFVGYSGGKPKVFNTKEDRKRKSPTKNGILES